MICYLSDSAIRYHYWLPEITTLLLTNGLVFWNKSQTVKKLALGNNQRGNKFFKKTISGITTNRLPMNFKSVTWRSLKDLKFIWYLVCSKRRANFVIVKHENDSSLLKKSIIEAQFSIAKTYLHALNLKTAHGQLHLSGVGFAIFT